MHKTTCQRVFPNAWESAALQVCPAWMLRLSGRWCLHPGRSPALVLFSRACACAPPAACLTPSHSPLSTPILRASGDRGEGSEKCAGRAYVPPSGVQKRAVSPKKPEVYPFSGFCARSGHRKAHHRLNYGGHLPISSCTHRQLWR